VVVERIAQKGFPAYLLRRFKHGCRVKPGMTAKFDRAGAPALS